MFNVKIKTNAVMIHEEEARRIRELGVDTIQISVYSHRPEVHDAITKLPHSFERTVKAIRFLREQGLRVTIANVLMTANSCDHSGVQELAAELGVHYTLDPTITPMMDGDTSILSLRIPGEELKEIFRNPTLVGNPEEFLAWNTQRQNGCVAVHHGRDRGIERVMHAEFGGKFLHSAVIGRICGHQHIGDGHSQSLFA